MSRHNASGAGSRHGNHVDAIASVLTRALRRQGHGAGSAAIILASRELSGPNDGAPMEIDCAVRTSYPPTIELMNLNSEEMKITQRILAEDLEGVGGEKWSDLVVIVRLRPGGVAVTALPSPASRLSEPGPAQQRREFRAQPTLSRLRSLLAMANIR